MVNNVLMRYPDSFGQRIKKLHTDRIYIIFKAQVNQSRGSWRIGTLRFYHIWAYHKKYSVKVFKNTWEHFPYMRPTSSESIRALPYIVPEEMRDKAAAKNKNKN